MRKLFGYLFGFATMICVFASLYLASAIYETSDKIEIQPYFFRLGLLSTDQIGNPKTLADVQYRKLRDWLAQKFVYEYLYIEPGSENIEQRTIRNGINAPLSYMSSPNVFDKWRQITAQDIREEASKGVRRTVTVFDEILTPEASDYLQVDYETKTWYKPNDMTEIPTVKRGTMYLNVDYTGEIKQPIDAVQNALRRGIDPAVVFMFYVQDVIIDEK
ncbi:MAG: hypothetical protein J5742_03485 [Alphaproteobacteria bacterium]|nr:hypothetical protein [Alphaproteobacteria bacterium]